MRFLIILLLLVVFQASAQYEEQEIRETLSDQEACWNEGDLECFMEGYWKSDQLVFIGKSGLSYGWENILANYKKNYPTKAEMGTLSFEIEIIEPLSDDFWFVVGKWHLEREEDAPEGYFSVIFRKMGDSWVIVADHSS